MNKRTTILAAATFVAATITVSAATVNNAYNAGDPRYMTTGCKYTGALVSGGSIGIWVKNITSYNNGASLFGSCHINGTSNPEQGVLLFVNSAGNFVFRVAGLKNGTVSCNDITAAASSNLRTDGSWHFLLGTFDVASGKSRFYIDGSQVGETDISISSLDSARCFATAVVGTTYEVTSSAEKYNYGAGFVGLFAEATVWNKALSAEEAATLFTRRACPWDDGLIGYWPLAKTSANLAQSATSRTDGSRPNALFYYRVTATDADFFDDPPNRFVASAEWVADKGYVQAAGATFQNPDAPATNATEAVAAATAGEKVFLMPGTHRISSQIDLTKANLTVTGKYPGYSGGEAVIDAQSLCRHFHSYSQASGQSGFVVENLTLVNGMAGDGGSMYFRSCTGIVRNCIFRSNATSTGSGGAIHSYTANGTVISNCVFASNSAGAYGGAIYTEQNTNDRNDKCFVIDCIITNNTASRSGGGIYAAKCIEINRCRFADNAANTHNDHKRGGAIYAGIYSKITGCAFTGVSTAVYGSCIEVVGANATVDGCDFTGLTPHGVGDQHYGIIHINNAGGFIFSDCAVTNTAIAASTSMFFAENPSASILVRQSLFDASVSKVVANHRAGKSRFENCTILSSTFDHKSDSSGQNVLVNCIVPNADITTSGNFVNIITNSLVKSVTGGTQDSNVMTGTPKFVDAAGGDYHLAYNSPCREKGIVLGWMAGATDFDGNPRLVNLLGRAAADALPDLGCYECQERGELPTVVSFR